MTTVTFTASTAGEDARMEQTFTLDELNIDESGSKEEIAHAIRTCFESWLMDSVSFSIVVDGLDVDVSGEQD
ncbi:hypothetical protein R3398_03105 [Rossellomorea marisflavi]|uniref:hypothetical protein n=1 Tax=Rossellomorea marisflavi TaxID=189381 RepID=UPI0006FAF99A|nr:hypothetical protein [Rossellomorea marisflavi]KQU63217.1 hypothetical protein ASG66_02055 [Bacillus sp. Leaf406]VXC32783.1 conserved hypothetical protein [Bacillus sp. 349Y]MCM2587934.1 hypothetical protein [Rossellomorea marisflavi]MDW4525360.1 hypothetical protein [Rossellomorea marisflavi]WJV18193.1 hypothetical protein QU593_18990 [Rossellomorea marisflavi]